MAGDEAAETWYVRARGRIQGPLSWAQLRALRERGQLARFDQVSRDRQSWAPADSLERLFPGARTGGAFLPGGRAKDRGPKPGPEPESDGFLILDQDDAGGSGPEPGGTVIDEPAGWYYAEAGTPQGPVGDGDLRRAARDGRIGPGTLYWRSGLEQWTLGSDLAELRHLWPHEADPAAAGRGETLPPRGQHREPDPTQAAPRIDPLAIVSIALNPFCGVGNIAAIVVGTVALRRIARSNGALAGKELALAGLLLGIVGLVTSVLALLALR